MTRIECDREEDVLAAVSTGRWPGRVDAELLAHVSACALCRDVVDVVAAFNQIDDRAAVHALPDSQVVWLRAQIRARAEATRLAQRPITVAQALAFAAIVGVLGTLAGASSPWLQGGLHAMGALTSHLDPRGFELPAGLATVLAEHLGVVALVAAGLMVMPVAVYWAIREN
jgi:hypothetical protein